MSLVRRRVEERGKKKDLARTTLPSLFSFSPFPLIRIHVTLCRFPHFFFSSLMHTEYRRSNQEIRSLCNCTSFLVREDLFRKKGKKQYLLLLLFFFLIKDRLEYKD